MLPNAKRLVSAASSTDQDPYDLRSLLGPLPSERETGPDLSDYESASGAPAIRVCTQCHEPLINPRMATCCGALMCAKHATTDDEAEVERACPTCSKTHVRLVVVDDVHGVFDSRQVQCPRRHYGCKWQGEWRALRQHMEQQCDDKDKEAIFRAVRDGNLDQVVALLDAKRTLANIKDPDGVTPLMMACEANSAALVEELLLRGARANAHCLRSCLFDDAVNADIVRLLLLAGARLANNPERCKEPLDDVVLGGHLEVVRLLLKAGVLDPTDAVLPAFQGHHVNLIRLLLDSGATIDPWMLLYVAAQDDDVTMLQILLSESQPPLLCVNQRDKRGQTPLHDTSDSPAIQELLIAKGAVVDTVDDKGETPLFKSRTAGSVNLLLAHGANVHHVNHSGHTPLFMAGTTEIAAALIAAGANVNAVDKEGNTPLMFQLACGYYGDVINMLCVHERVDVLRVNKSGQTALWFAANIRREQAVKYLLDRDHSDLLLSIADSVDSLTPLHRAAANNSIGLTVFQLLTSKVATASALNTLDNQGRTALLLAAERGEHGKVDVLLNAGAETEHVHTIDGQTALLRCTWHPESLTALIRSKANLEHLDVEGRSALIIAAECKDYAAMNALLKAGARTDHARKLDDRTALLICASATEDLFGPTLSQFLQAHTNLKQQDSSGQTALCIAAAAGNEWMVQRLLDAGGADVNHCDNNGRTSLLLAIHGCHEATARLLLDAGADFYVADKEESTPLICAARCGIVAIVEALLQRGADVGSQNMLGFTALGCAVMRRHEAVVRLLLSSGAVNCILGLGALDLAALNNIPEVVKILFDFPAVLQRNSAAALLEAARRGHSEIVEILLEAAEASESQEECRRPRRYCDEPDSYSGNTPLICAIKGGHVDVVRKLLAAYADVRATGRSGWSPLLHAAYLGQPDVVSLLIRAGALVNRRDTPAELTPLLLASCSGHKAVVDVLLSKGADPTIGDVYNDTPLVCACRNGHAVVARQLVLKGKANEQLCSKALLEASARGHSEVVEVLLLAGASVAYTDSHGITPLMLAAEGGHLAVVQSLLLACSSCAATVVDAVDNNYGWTALAYATAAGNTDVISALLDAGADANTTDVYGNSLLSLAVSNLCVEAAQLLLSRGKANVNHPNEDGAVPLLASILFDEYEVTGGQHDESGAPLAIPPVSDRQEEMFRLVLRFAPDLLKTCGVPELAVDCNALQLVSFRRAPRLVQTLLPHASLQLAPKNGLSSLMCAILGSQHPKADPTLATVHLLLGAGADVNQLAAPPSFGVGCTALYLAAETGEVAAVRMLLAQPGVQVNVPNQDGVSPLAIAARCDHIHVVNLLIAAGADVNTVDKRGNTPLLGASSLKVIEALLAAHADADACNEQKDTALARAVSRRHLDAVLSLLKVVKNVDAADERGYTPLGLLCLKVVISRTKGRDDPLKIADALLQAGADPQRIHWEPHNQEMAAKIKLAAVERTRQEQLAKQ